MSAKLPGWLNPSCLGYKARRAVRRARQGLAAMAAPARRVTVRSMPAQRAPDPAGEIVVLSANLWHDWPLRRGLPERLEAFARLIEAEGVDVVLVQEAVRVPDLAVDRWLAERLGMNSLYTRANGHRRTIGFEEGLAVFARFPLGSHRVRRLEARLAPFVNRLALGAEIDTPHGSLWAFSVHLSMLPHHNASQIGELHSWVGDVTGDRPAIIGGDFNAPEHARRMQRARSRWLDTFRHLHPHADGTTHELRWPWGGALLRNRLDYLFLHAHEPTWRVIEARHLTCPVRPHSDHQAVLARLKARS